MNQRKLSILAALVLVASMNVQAQRSGRGGNHQGPGRGGHHQQPQEIQQVVRINQTISHGQQLNLSRKLNLQSQRGLDLVAVKIKAEDMSYRGSTQLTLLADQRVVQTIYLTSSYSTQQTIIIPQHISQARYKPTLTLEVRGSAHVQKITAVLQDTMMGPGGNQRPQITIKHVNQRVSNFADIPIRQIIGNTHGKKLIGLRVGIQKHTSGAATLQLMVNNRMTGRSVRVHRGDQSVDIPIGMLRDMVMGEDARSVKLAVDGRVTITKIIARTKQARGGRYVGGNTHGTGNGHNGRSRNNGNGRRN